MSKPYRKPYHRPKVKRYRRSFYSKQMKLHRALGIAALVAAVLLLAWFAAPHVLDWATHTWYTSVRGLDLSSSSAPAAESEASAESAAQSAAPTATPAPTAAPAAAQSGAEIVEGTWSKADTAALTDEAAIRAEAQRLAGAGATYALITLKDSSGNIYYSSSVSAASASITDAPIDAALTASIFKEYGLVPVAQIAAFRDPVASYTDRSMAIHYRSGGESDYLWLDAANAAAGGKAWLNPYSTAAVDFVGDLIAELHTLGYSHVALTCVQFPTAVSSKQDFGSTGGVSRAQQLAADISAWQARFNGAVTLWCSYSLSECTGTPASLGASAVSLGEQNLLITAGAAELNDDARAALLQAAADAGVENIMFYVS